MNGAFMARHLKLGLAVAWPILIMMLAQTWAASRWVSKVEGALESVERQMAERKVQTDRRLERIENDLYFKINKRDYEG